MSTSDFSKITVGVIGLGLMGGSFAKRFKEIGNRVIGINRTKSAEEEALRMGIIDSADPKDLKECRIVVSCTPEKATKAFLEENLSLLARDAILTDIAGVKDGFADIAESLILPTQDFISGHPMCGREGAGLSQASADIFKGANYIVIPRKSNRKENVALIEEMIRALGCAHAPAVTAHEHDEIIAYTSDLPHAAAAALMNSASYRKDTNRFTGGSFRDETRVSDINEELWTSLFLSNRENVLTEIERFEAALETLRRAIEEKNEDSIRTFLSEAGRRRREWDSHGSSEYGSRERIVQD